jgi:hypothetical protein
LKGDDDCEKECWATDEFPEDADVTGISKDETEFEFEIGAGGG